MKIRKLAVGITAVATLAALACSMIVTADDKFIVSISNTTVKAGEEFTLTLDMTSIPTDGLNGCEFGIAFDSSIVTVDSIAAGTLVTSADAEAELPEAFDYYIEDDVINVMYAIGVFDPTIFLNGSGNFLTVSGTVNSDAKPGDKSDFKIVPIGRSIVPGASETISEAIFGYMDQNDNIINYAPTLKSGYVLIDDEEATEDPTEEMTESPTKEPTEAPTEKPTESPTKEPTEAPTEKPTESPTKEPTEVSTKPTESATDHTENPVVDFIPGDVTADEKINVFDSVALRDILTSEYPTQDILSPSPADTDGNGTIQLADLVNLNKYLTGKDVVLKRYNP